MQGRKTVRDRKILEVHVDKGMTDGQKIVFSGEGDQEPGLEPGDLVIVLEEKEHDVSTLYWTILLFYWNDMIIFAKYPHLNVRKKCCLC